MSSIPPVQGPPPGAEERFGRMLKARADALTKPVHDDLGRIVHEPLNEIDATKTAIKAFSGFVNQHLGDDKSPLMDYLEGRTENFPEGWIPSTETVISPENFTRNSMHDRARKARLESPWLASAHDAINMASGYAEGRLQSAVDIAVGGANLIPGVNLDPINVKASLRAAAQTYLYDNPTTTAQAASEIQAMDETAGSVARITKGVGEMGGNIQTMVGSGKFGAPFRAGAAVGGKVGSWVGATGSKVNLLARKIGASAGGFGVHGALVAGQTKDETTGEVRQSDVVDRAMSLGWSTVEGAAIGALGEVGKMAFRAMLKTPVSKLLANEKQAIDQIQSWAKEKKMLPFEREGAEAYSRRITNEWIDSGMPGGPRFLANELIGRAMQGGIEGLGFSILDLHMRRDLLQAALDGDEKAWNEIGESYLINAFGTMAMHMPLKDIPSWQRRQDVTPTGKEQAVEPAPQEPSKVAKPEAKPVDPAGGGLESGPTRMEGDQEPASLNAGSLRPELPKIDQATGTVVGGQPSLMKFGWVDVFRGPDGSGEPIKGFDPSMTPDQLASIPRGSTGSMEIPGTNLRFDVEGDVAKPSQELRDALGLPESLPVAEMSAVLESASLRAALKAKEVLPGSEISVEGVHATADGVMRKILPDGSVVESPISPKQSWVEAAEVPSRGKDPIPAEQQEIVDVLTELVNGRDDLKRSDLALLSQVASTMDTVSAVNDRSVAETLTVTQHLIPPIISGDPVTAGRAIKALAETLTIKAPEVVMREVAEENKPYLLDPETGEPWASVDAVWRNYSDDRSTGGENYAAAATEVAEKMFGKNAVERLNDAAIGEIDKADALRFSDSGKAQEFADKIEKRATEMSMEPPSDEVASRNSGIPLTPEAKEALRFTAQGMGEWAGKAWKAYQSSLTRRLDDVGLKKEADIIRRGVAEQGKYEARLSEAGIYDMARMSRKQLDSVNKLVSDKFGGHTTVGAAAMDEGLASHFGEQTLTPKQRAVVDKWAAVHLEGARIAEELGVKFVNRPEGSTLGITADPNRRRLVRTLTPEGRQALYEQSGPLWEAIVRWHEGAEGKTREQVQKQYNEARSLITSDATEFIRFQKVMPTKFTVGDKIVDFLIDTPLEHAKALAFKNSHVMSARAVMPREAIETPEGFVEDPTNPLPKTAQQMVNKVFNTPGQRGNAEMVAEALRALHGMALYQPPKWMGTPGSAGYHLARVISDIGGVMKAMALSMSAPMNVFEPMTNATHLTAGSITRGYGEVFSSFKSGAIRKMHRELVKDGWLEDSKESHRLGGSNLMEKFENGMEKLQSGLMTPMRISQSMNEMVIASAAKERLAEMKAGRGSIADVNALKLLEFTTEEARSMINGDGTPEQYDRYKRIVRYLAGGKALHSVEKSLASHHRGFNALVWFTGFFQTRTRLIDSLVRDMAQATDLDGKVQMALQLAKVAGFTMTAGAASQILLKWLRGGSDEVSNYIRESTSGATATEQAENIATSTLSLLSSGLLGGLGQPIINTISGPEGGETFAENMGKVISSTVAPIQAVGKVYDLVNALRGADVPGYENKGAIGKIYHYITKQAPLAKTLHDGVFGLGMLAVSEKDPEVESACKSLYRWRAKNKPVTDINREEQDRAFSDAMKLVFQKVQEGGSYGDEDLMDAMIDAQDKFLERADLQGKITSRKQAKAAVAASLRRRKLITDKSDISPVEMESMHAHLGEKNVEVLESFDGILEELAKRINPPSIR